MRVVLAPAQVGENARDDVGLGHGGDDANVAPALGAAAQIEVENAIEASHPAHRRGGDARSVIAGPRSGRGASPRDDETAVLCIGGENAVIP